MTDLFDVGLVGIDFFFYYIIDEVVLENDDVPLKFLYHKIVPNSLGKLTCSS